MPTFRAQSESPAVPGGVASGLPSLADLRLTFPGTAESVRRSLLQVMGWLRDNGLAQTERDAAEVVLAEVLNNIAEHAYAQGAGDIDLVITVNPALLVCTVQDTGVALPGGMLPAGRRADVAVPMEALPEGGFGWFLIRALTQDLWYERKAGRNHLRFSIVLPPIARAGSA